MMHGFIALCLLTMTLAVQAAPVGYKLHAGGAGGGSGESGDSISSVADLKRWDEANLSRGEAVGKAAVSKSGKIDKEMSPADVKRQDEIKVKNVLAAQEKEKREIAQMLARAKTMMETKPAPNYVSTALDAAGQEGVMYGIKQVVEWTFGSKWGGPIGVAIDLLQPFNPLEPVEPYDLPRTKNEMKALRKYLEQYEQDQKALKAPLGTPTSIPDATLDPKFDGLRTPAALAEVEFKRSVLAAVKVKNADAGYIVERLMESSMSANSEPLSDDVIQVLEVGLIKVLPPNICRITANDVCTLNTGVQGDACMCPKLELGGYDMRRWARGVAARRPVSDVCDAPVGKCTMSATGPVGSPCFCIPTFFVAGPMPIGKIVPPQRAD
ncbi:hypothetical protein [Pseudomonas fluorescens]